jgi:hypothetical protein
MEHKTSAENMPGMDAVKRHQDKEEYFGVTHCLHFFLHGVYCFNS